MRTTKTGHARTFSLAAVAWVAALAGGCASGTFEEEPASALREASAGDGSLQEAASPPDALDAADEGEAGLRYIPVTDDAGASDGGELDSSGDVLDEPMHASRDEGGPTGTPCQWAVGWTAWRFHFDPAYGASAVVDVYALPDSSNWTVTAPSSAQVVDVANGGGVVVDYWNSIDVAYSLAGLSSITHATLTVLGRSYSDSDDGSLDFSPLLYDDVITPQDSVSHLTPYAAASVDFTSAISVGDPPSFTVVSVYAGPTSDLILVNTVELCIDGS